MSNSSAIGDSGAFSGQKMSFSQTCNLLSQYVKGKRAISGEGYNRATMNLFPVSGKAAAEDTNGGCIGRTINLFPQVSGFNPQEQSSLVPNACVTKTTTTEPAPAQMTIFYGGQVMVFNDLPADKAKEVMDLASTFESSLKKRKVEPANLTPPSPGPITITTSNPNPIPNLSPNQNSGPNKNLNVQPSFGNNVIPAVVMPRAPMANVTDLPIARKASLHRFLEKRKDRLVGKTLPSTTDVTNGGSSKPNESKAWLGLASLPGFQPQQPL